MKKTIYSLSVIVSLLSATLNAQTTFNWAKQIESYGSTAIRVTTDAAGNVYTLGKSDYNGADFDPSSTATFTLNAGTYIQKLDANGNFVWAKNIEQQPTSPQGSNTPGAICLDNAGDIIIIGNYTGIIDVDPSSTSSYTLNADYVMGMYTKLNVYTLKLNATTGNFVWAKEFVGSAGSATGTFIASGIDVDNSNNIFTTGYYNQNTPDFDPSTSSSYTLTLYPNYLDAFVTKLDASGNFVWAKSFSGTLHDQSNSIAIDAAGNVYTGGYFSNTVDFDPSPATFTLTSNGLSDGYISKLSNSGNFIWVKKIASTIATNTDRVSAIATDINGDLAVTGFQYGTGSAAGVMYVEKYRSSGALAWHHDFSSLSVSNDIATDINGNIYTTGNFAITVDFNPIAGPIAYLTSAGAQDIFISKLDSTGNFSSAHKVGGTGNDYGKGISVSSSFGVHTVGDYSSVADFDPTPGTFSLNPVYSYDSYVLKLTSSCSASIAVNSGSICSGKSFTITPSGASSYTYSSGSAIVTPASTSNYTVTGTTSGGCFGTAVSTISVNATTTITGITTSTSNLCIGNSTSAYLSGYSGPSIASYTWSNGSNSANPMISPTVTTTYTVTITNTLGCTSSASVTQIVSNCGGVGLYENEANNIINIYPNPVNDILNIDLSNHDASNISIINALGEIVFTENVSANHLSLKTNNLISGIYFIKVESKHKTSTIKFIKQ